MKQRLLDLSASPLPFALFTLVAFGGICWQLAVIITKICACVPRFELPYGMMS